MFWNKIHVDNLKITLQDNDPYYLEIDKNVKIDVQVLENVSSKLVIIGHNNYEINIHLLKNSFLIVNSLNRDSNANIKIYLKENSNIIFNYSVLSIKDSINNYEVIHEENNSTSVINNNGINMENNKLFFNIDGIIKKELKNISCSQNSKIINFKDGDSKIIPNLIVDSNDIMANHSAYIGKIDDEEKFYMASRGISDIDIKKLIYKSVLLGKMELLEEEEEFNKIINEWW